MNDTEGAGRMSIGALLAIVGGALMGIGSFLAWAQVSGGGTSVSAKGVDGSDGYVTLAAGAVALLLGLVMTKKASRWLAILVLLAGLVGAGLGIYDALTAKDSVLDAAADELAPSFGVSADEIRVLLDQAVDAGQLSITISIGLYVVIAGGVLAFVGGLMGLMGGRRSEVPASMPPAEPSSMPGSTPTQPPGMPGSTPTQPPAMPPSDPGAG